MGRSGSDTKECVSIQRASPDTRVVVWGWLAGYSFCIMSNLKAVGENKSLKIEFKFQRLHILRVPHTMLDNIKHRPVDINFHNSFCYLKWRLYLQRQYSQNIRTYICFRAKIAKIFIFEWIKIIVFRVRSFIV